MRCFWTALFYSIILSLSRNIKMISPFIINTAKRASALLPSYKKVGSMTSKSINIPQIQTAFALFSSRKRMSKPEDWELRRARGRTADIPVSVNQVVSKKDRKKKVINDIHKNGTDAIGGMEVISSRISLKDNEVLTKGLVVERNGDKLLVNLFELNGSHNRKVLCSQSPKLHNTNVVAGDTIQVAISSTWPGVVAENAGAGGCSGSLTNSSSSSSSNDRPVVVHVNKRKNVLQRPSATSSKHKLQMKGIAANIDHLLIVTCTKPPCPPLTIDRFTVAAAHHNIPNVTIVVNKMDLEGADDLKESLLHYESIGYPVVGVSAESGCGMTELRRMLSGRTSIFVGQSGVGKSSLINKLLPNADILVGDLVANAAIGAHTTSNAFLHAIEDVPDDNNDNSSSSSSSHSRSCALPVRSDDNDNIATSNHSGLIADGAGDGVGAVAGDGGYIIDSPGIRELGVWHLDRASIEKGFQDIDKFAKKCYFRDCRHTAEQEQNLPEAAAVGSGSGRSRRRPVCAVRQAVREGELHPQRLLSYLTLLENT